MRGGSASSLGKELPDGWRWAALGDVARLFAGGSAPQADRYFSSEGPPFFRVSDVGRCKRTDSLSDSQDHLSNLALSELKLVPVESGTIVFPKSGAAVNTNNRAVIRKDGYLVSHLMAVEVRPDVADVLWVYWALCQIDMAAYSDNASYPALRQSVVEGIEIPLPPFEEQKRIAAILAEQLAAVEQAREASEARMEAIHALPAALLRQAFSGAV